MITPNPLDDVIVELDGQLPTGVLEFFAELCSVGEQGIAIEELCSMIVEHDAIISSATYNTLKSECERMQIDEEYWKSLQPRLRESQG